MVNAKDELVLTMQIHIPIINSTVITFRSK